MIADHDPNDVRGKPCIELNLSGDSETNMKLRNGALKILHAKVNLIGNLKRVNVAPHNWSLAQSNQYFSKRSKMRMSTPKPFHETSKVAHSVDRKTR